MVFCTAFGSDKLCSCKGNQLIKPGRAGRREAEPRQKSHAAVQPARRLRGWFSGVPPALPLFPLGWGWGGHPASHQGRELPRQAYADGTAPRGNLVPEKVKCCKDPLWLSAIKMRTHGSPRAHFSRALARASCNQSPTS